MTRDEIEQLERLEAEYLAERLATPEPTRAEWDAAWRKWEGRVNVESLIGYGVRRGWIK